MKKYKPTYKQLRSLYLIAPGPMGLGLSMREASRRLGLRSPSSVCLQLIRFRKHHPEAWSTIEAMLNSMKRQGKNLLRPLRLEHGRRRWEEHIIEKF